jgi:hypothetical protein
MSLVPRPLPKIITVYPVEGRLIFMPDRGFQRVPAEGVKVHATAHYTRAVNQGDLTLTPPASVVAAEAKKVAAAAVATPATPVAAPIVAPAAPGSKG